MSLVRWPIVVVFFTVSIFTLPVIQADYKAAIKAYVAQDYKTAFKLLVVEADKGDQKALFSLGLLYYNGQGVEKNSITAQALFVLAKDRKSKRAQSYIDALAPKLVDGAAEKGIELATRFKPGNIREILGLEVNAITETTTNKIVYADEPKGETNDYLGDLPIIIHSYALKMTKLEALYMKSENDEEKEKLEIERDAKIKEYIELFDEYIKTEPLVGNELPFKVASNNLPFEVLGVKLSKITSGTSYFEIQVKINRDIREPDGEISQSLAIHFAAVDSKDNIIPDTWNWAYTQDFNALESGFITYTRGHWNANRIQYMKDFAYIRIMSEEDYKKMKEEQKRK